MIGDGLKTDLYQLAMIAASYFLKNKHQNRAICEAFARKMPDCRKFMIMAGTESIRDYLINLRFTRDDINFLRDNTDIGSVMSHTNLEQYLEDFKFAGSLWSMAEGEVVFENEPLVRVMGTLPEVHMAETFILSVLNHDIHVASKAARIVLAARGRSLLEFGTRRTHHQAALDAARSAYLVGFDATSNLRASQKFGIPCVGTMSHMWIMLSDNEDQAFRDFAKSCYNKPVLLIDTYDVIEGAKKAVGIPNLGGVRLDSGDFLKDSKIVREILDSSGHTQAKIIVSGDMDEYKIDRLLSLCAPIDTFGVGTEVVQPRDVHSLGLVYKAVYDVTRRRPVVKLSPGKATVYPGSKQVFFNPGDNGRWRHLVAEVSCESSGEFKDLTPLLDCYIIRGAVCDESMVDLGVSRKYCNIALTGLYGDLAAINKGSSISPVDIHSSLVEMLDRIPKQ
jgi:nicotinate phosphoribosyltransferase